MDCVRIGNVEVRGRLVLAPLADINKPSFRLLCKEKGAALVYTEMINAEGVVRGGSRSLDLARTLSAERPVSVQLFGSRAGTMSKAAAEIEKRADIIDINAGCYVHRVTKQGAGCALMKNPQGIGDIVREVVGAVKTPVTVKIRLGPSRKNRNYLEVAKIAESAGASAIALHARSGDTGFGGAADWSAIREIKEAVSVPVIGNGDVRTPQDCARMLEETGCDLVMIGRAALGNPHVFEQCSRFIESGELLPAQTASERMKDLRRLFELHEKYDRPSTHNDVVFMRQHAMMFTTGLEGGVVARTRLSNADDRNGILKEFSSLLSRTVR
jgi:tRNA-dihydrouridine synthase B